MERKDMDETIKNTFDEIRFYGGLLIGLFLGILGNLCVSFLIETIHAFGTTLFYTWLVVFLASLITTFLISRWLAIRIVKPFLDVFYTMFPSLKPKQRN